MSGKMLLRLYRRKSPRWILRHSSDLAFRPRKCSEFEFISQLPKDVTKNPRDCRIEKRKYLKIWIFNYFLFISLTAMIFYSCIVFKSSISFIAMSIGLMLYLILFLINHANRITRSECPGVNDYAFASEIMIDCSRIGVYYAAIALLLVVIFS